MPDAPTWLNVILVGIIAATIFFFFRGGFKATLEESSKAPKDWPGFLLPIGLVVLFVILLIAMVR